MLNFSKANLKNIKLIKLAPYLIFTVAVMVSAFILFSSQVDAQISDTSDSDSSYSQLAAVCSSGYYCSGSQRWYRARNCSTRYIQTCSYGCSGGSCNPAPPPPPPSCSPTNATWSGWTDTSSCTQSCGGGTKTQSRTCQGTASCGGTNYCVGPSTQTVSCNTQACPVNGSCGSNATNYAYNAGGYSGSFCSSGSASPSNPSFPSQGGSTNWSCSGSNGGSNASCTATRSPAPPTVSISVSPSTITQGSSATLSWSSSGASRCNVTNVGSVQPNTFGATTVSPSSGTTYTMSCSNSSGTTSGSASLTVNIVIPFTYTVSVSRGSDGNISILKGNTSIFAVTTTKTGGTTQPITLSVSGLPSQANASFSPNPCAPNISCSISMTISTTSNTPAGTFPITVTGSPNGTSATVNLVITALTPTADVKANNSDASITIAYNTAATISWSSGNASACSVSPSGWTGTSGSQSSGNLTSGRTYSISCSGTGGTSPTDTVTVNVSQPPAPTATLQISNNPNGGYASSASISYNTAAYLKWFSTNAGSCSVSPGGWSGTSNTYGQSTGSLTQSQTYTLNCTGAGGTTSAPSSVTVNVAAPSLNVNFSVTPTSGSSPLNTTFSSSVSGQAIGTINYNYWWNCGYNGTSIAGIEVFCGTLPPVPPGNCASNLSGYRCAGVNTNPQSMAHQYACASGTCNYNAKVIVERGSASAVQAIIPVSVSLPGLSVSCAPGKLKTTKGERVIWTSSVTGGGGFGTYTYSWGGTAPLAGQTSALGDTTYTTAGTKTGSLTVTSSSQTRTVNCSSSVDVRTPGIKVLPPLSTIRIDNTQQLVSEYYPYGCNSSGVCDTSGSADVSNSASWSSTNSAVASINNTSQKGLATGEGTNSQTSASATIYANYTDQYGNLISASTSNGTTASVTVTTRAAPVCSPTSSTGSTGQNITFSSDNSGNPALGYSWSVTGGSPATGTGTSFITKFNSAGTYSVVLKNGSLLDACSVVVSSAYVTITDPITLTPNPNNQAVPVNGVDISATITSNVNSSSNFTFYCNRSDAGTNVITGYAAKHDGVPAGTLSKTAVDACNYTTPGTYTAKVIVERGGAVAERRYAFTVLPALSVDIKADSSDGPISIESGTSATLSWRTTNAVTCSASGGTGPNWSGSKPVAESVPYSQSTGVLSVPGEFKFTITCTSSDGRTASNDVYITVNPSLSITSFTVSPAGKETPGSGNNMSVSISSNITGVSNNYTFYCNKSGPDSDTVVTGGWTHKKDGESSMNYDPPAWPCHYSSAGNYTAKVIVERGGISRAAHVDIVVLPNVAPTVNAFSPSAPSNYCVAPFGWTLSWNFSDAGGDTQYAYQAVITDQGTGGVVKDTGQVVSSSGSYNIPLATLDFNKTYDWRVTVWESDPARLSAQANGSSFTTIKHAAPALSFSMLPLRASKDEPITFTDTTTVSGGATKTAWNWDFSEAAGATVIGPTNASTASASFSTPGSKNIKLRVTDSDGLVCEKGSNENNPADNLPDISIGRSLPSFKEILPR
ncbi:MAG: hypothetical protein Q8Q95_00395 [bacterium]|nr:hypothetical protein [bacterium]